MTQNDWRWCHKCQGLYFAGNPSQGVCPADGQAHENQGSGNYKLTQDNAVPDWQENWRWCHKCQGLHFAGNPSQGICPADGQAHEMQGSGNYSLVQNLELASLLLASVNPPGEFGTSLTVINGDLWNGKVVMSAF